MQHKMGITKKVVIKTSEMVSLPMIMGFFKPVILLPMQVVTGFSKEQLETILAHELAHLQRQDFLFNALQSVLDVIYFFHPAMWLISALIRKERENCCDDMALKVSGDKMLLAKTLVQLQEKAYAPSLAMAFGKKSYTLLERVQRIVGIKQNQNFSKESIWIVFGLFVTFFAFAQKTEDKATNVKIEKMEAVQIVKTDTTISPKSKNSNLITIQNNKHDFRITDNKILFDGEEVQLSPEVKVKVDQRLKAIEINQQQMESQGKLMEAEGKKMEEIGMRMGLNSKPMEEVGKKMEEIGKKMEMAAKKYEEAYKGKDLTEKQIEAIEKRFEKQMAEYDAQMDQYSKQMDELSAHLEEHSAPMEALSAKMDELAAPMDAMSEELDKNINEIIEMLPADIKSKIKMDKPKAPKPPKPPKPVKVNRNENMPPPPPKAPKPPKPPKDRIKSVPQPPPAPIKD